MKGIRLMFAHLRAHVLLVALTLLLCCVAYPLVLLGASWLMPERASGSLIHKDGKVVGSSLIARKFTDNKYFWPRPSAGDYNAMASGGSNYGANNIKLRDRAARLIAPVARYASGPKKGELAGPDVEAWFREKPDRTKVWAEQYPTLASSWLQDNADAVKAWQAEHSSDKDFFVAFTEAHPGTWPAVKDKRITPVSGGEEVWQTFFDSWLRHFPADQRPDLEKVPADYVTASGSGLDPHISLSNARFQAPRVIDAWSAVHPGHTAEIKKEVERLIQEHSFAPMGGAAGGDRLVNVLELNLALDDAMSRFGK
jgi:K+-transporting ATPase ATPase C chain